MECESRAAENASLRELLREACDQVELLRNKVEQQEITPRRVEGFQPEKVIIPTVKIEVSH